MSARTGLVSLLAAAAAAGCAPLPTASSGLMDVLQKPAEKALLSGIRAYEDAQYPEAESRLKTALQTGLASPRDQAAAHKYLAFIYCSSNRERECGAGFRLAHQADPGFALSRSEAGHPLWAEVYKRVRPQ